MNTPVRYESPDGVTYVVNDWDKALRLVAGVMLLQPAPAGTGDAEPGSNRASHISRPTKEVDMQTSPVAAGAGGRAGLLPSDARVGESLPEQEGA